MAGAAAFAAAIVAKEALAPELVSATDGQPLIVGGPNTSTGQTVLQATNTTNAAFRVFNNTTTAPDNEPDGIQAFITGANNSGMLARNDDLNGVGIYGIATNGTGIGGQSVGGSAISGSSTSGAGGYFTTNSGAGVYSVSGSSYGVYGQTNGSGAAIYGVAPSGIGLNGVGGVYGIVGGLTGTGIALYGSVSGPNTVGFAGGAANGGIAGQFAGGATNFIDSNVTVAISPGQPGRAFVCGPGVTKNAAVPTPDGSTVLLHSVEAPEAWFEDYGEGTVTGGKADIKLDPTFAGVVDTNKMHVFITETGDHNGLHVTGKNANGFSVSASPSLAKAAGTTVGSVSGTFSYRVVALRKDVKNERFTKFDVPKELKFPPPPKAVTPKAPVGPARHKDGAPKP